MRNVLLLVLLLCLTGIPAFAKAGRPGEPAGSGPAVGKTAPDFTLRTLQGESYTLSELRGKVVFLNFWATWCPPCRAEMPSIERLNEVMAGEDFVILAVNVEQDGERAVKAFLENHPHSFPVLLDGEGKVQETYGVYRFPETFLIGKDGKIVEHFLGARDWSSVEFLKQINALAGE